MSLRVRFHAAARAEFIEATAWYDERQPGLGAVFVEEIDRCLASAAERPEMFPMTHGELRRVVARRFPYCIYFREDAEGIFVFAVFHASRDPTVWQQRS